MKGLGEEEGKLPLAGFGCFSRPVLPPPRDGKERAALCASFWASSRMTRHLWKQKSKMMSRWECCELLWAVTSDWLLLNLKEKRCIKWLIRTVVIKPYMNEQDIIFSMENSYVLIEKIRRICNAVNEGFWLSDYNFKNHSLYPLKKGIRWQTNT